MIDLEFNHVSKKYVVRADDYGITEGMHPMMRQWRKLRPLSETFWAVRDVSFQIKRGEAVGIIGHNGAGKSTMLKLLSNITAPSEGEITINGRLSALIEVGSGFHPELTGRENVFLSGSILGMSRRDIAAKLDSIVEFAGVRQFIDTPVKRYSSGMYVRLGFAIVAHLEPDILLLDEVLAVGDAAFQAKCIQRITDLEKAGTTIVFISHDLTAVERLCSRVILMSKGEIASEGRAANVIKAYHQAAAVQTAATFRSFPPAHQHWLDVDSAPGNDVVRLRSVRVRTTEGDTADMLNMRLPIGVEMTYDVMDSGHVLIPNFHFVNQDGVHVFAVQDVNSEWRTDKRPPGRYVSTAWIPGNLLAEGAFTVGVGVSSHLPYSRVHAVEENALGFHVVERFDGETGRGDYLGVFPGVIRPVVNWSTQFEQAG